VSFFSRFFGRKAVAQPEGLISLLRDIGAPFEDRVDAAWYLGDFDEALPVLVEIALRPGEDEALVDHCGESLKFGSEHRALIGRPLIASRKSRKISLQGISRKRLASDHP
jgi:hypothetical protein